MQKFIGILALLLCCWPLMCAAGNDEDIYRVEVTGTLETDQEGRVSRYIFDKRQPDAIEKGLVRDIVQWRFEPILVDGHPVSGKTAMRLDLEARQVAKGQYQVRIANASFGEPQRKKSKEMVPPTYPFPAVRIGLQARVVLVLQLDGEGNVVRMHAEQVGLDHATRSEATAQRWRRLFVQSSMQAAAKWSFNINQFAAGEPIGVTVRVPVVYQLLDDGRPVTAAWQRFVTGPRTPAPWIPVEEVAVAQHNIDSLNDGDTQSLNSLFRPVEPIAGRVF